MLKLLCHFWLIMLLLLFLAAQASSQALDSPASELQAFTEVYTLADIVETGTAHVYVLSLIHPAITYMTLKVTMAWGDADLVVATRVGAQVASWTSRKVGDDRVHITVTDPQLQGDGKGMLRDFEVAVVGYSRAQYTLTITIGSGTAMLASDVAITPKSVKAFTSLMQEFESSESQGLGTWGVSIVALGAVEVLVAVGLCVMYRRRTKAEAAHDGYLHLVTA